MSPLTDRARRSKEIDDNPREKKIDEKLVMRFKTEFKGGVAIKHSMPGAYGTAGWPDRQFIWDKEICFVELKRKGNKPTPLQLQRMAELRAVGMRAAWFDNVDDAWAYVEACMHGDDP